MYPHSCITIVTIVFVSKFCCTVVNKKQSYAKDHLKLSIKDDEVSTYFYQTKTAELANHELNSIRFNYYKGDPFDKKKLLCSFEDVGHQIISGETFIIYKVSIKQENFIKVITKYPLCYFRLLYQKIENKKETKSTILPALVRETAAKLRKKVKGLEEKLYTKLKIFDKSDNKLKTVTPEEIDKITVRNHDNIRESFIGKTKSIEDWHDLLQKTLNYKYKVTMIREQFDYLLKIIEKQKDFEPEKLAEIKKQLEIIKKKKSLTKKIGTSWRYYIDNKI